MCPAAANARYQNGRRGEQFMSPRQQGNTESGRLAGKAALVTGGASGIGLAAARRFVAEGARVAITDRDEALGAPAARDLGPEAFFIRHDVTSEADWRSAMDETASRFGTVNVLLNSAGIFRFGTVEDTTLEEWRQTIAVNLDGTFLGCREAVRAMREHGGSIVNMSSISGLVGSPDNAAYDASKGGVRLLTKSVALYCAREGYHIRCNSVHPGGIDTPMVQDYFAARPDPAAEEDAWLRHTPIGRLGRAEEIASLILYLASDESSFVTGSEFTIDGGMTAT